MVSVIPSLLIAVVVILSLWLLFPALFKYLRNWRLYRTIPMPKYVPCHWLFGHARELTKRNEELATLFGRELNESGERPPTGIMRIYIGPLVSVGIVHSKYVQEILKEPKSDEFYGLLLPWLGDGLLIAEGSKWFRNRRLLTPAFHYSILKNYVSIYKSCVSVLVGKWRKVARERKSVAVFETVCPMSLDIILQCAFSFRSDCQEDKTQHPYVQACSQLVHRMSDRGINPFYRIDWIYWLTPHGRKTNQLCKLVHDHAEKVIDERKAALEHNSTIEERSSEGNGSISTKLYDFLDILLMARDEEGRGMSDLEIRNEVDTFMFEGHDTTTSGMSWTLYCLAQHPEHQDKIREEVRSVLKGREWLEYEDLKQLTYTSWCIKEAMRLYPPVFEFFRKASRDIKLDNMTIPEGTNIGISSYQIHRNGSIWKDPLQYDPLRFQLKNLEKQGPYDYIPFSAGSRNCIGQNFAMNEMKVVIGTIISQFELETDPDHYVDLQFTVVLRAKKDIKLFLKEL